MHDLAGNAFSATTVANPMAALFLCFMEAKSRREFLLPARLSTTFDSAMHFLRTRVPQVVVQDEPLDDLLDTEDPFEGIDIPAMWSL